MKQDKITLNGETYTKARFGLASINDKNKTFTGDVLYKKDAPQFGKSIEEKWEDAAQLRSGLVIWRSNGAVPFADMLLDFHQIGKLTLLEVEQSIRQREKDEIIALDLLERDEQGRLWLAENALDYRDERLEELAWSEIEF